MKDLVTNKKLVTFLERKQRTDYIQEKLKPYVDDFLLDGDYTRIDTKQSVEEVNDPQTGSKVNMHRQIWLIVNKHQQYLLFQNSDHYQNFKNDHEDATATYTIWRLVLKRVDIFTSKPKPE